MEEIPLPLISNDISADINEETEDENELPLNNQIKTEIPPLPINSDINPKEEPHLSPPPLPITDDNTDIKPPPPQIPLPPSYDYRHIPHSHSYSPTHLPSSHLRGPPPLTPMERIASDGSVITPINSNDLPPIVNNNNNHFMAPPPPPHINRRPIEYKCIMCRIQFNTKGELVRHNRNIHPRDNSYNNDIGAMGKRLRFYCNICGRSFGGKQHFEYHMRTHSGEKPYKCQTCGKAFRAKHSLKNHLRIHSGERPYQCKVCGKWFRQLGVMKNHIKNMHSH